MLKAKFGAVAKLGMLGVCLYVIAGSGILGIFDSRIGWETLAAALAVQPIVLCCMVVMGIRHLLLVGLASVSLNVSFRAIVLSQGLNLVIPARLSELLKATYLRDHANVPLSSGLSAIVLERTVDVLIVAALGALALLSYFDRGDFASIPALGFILVVSVFVLVRFPGPVLYFVRALPSVRLAGFLERTYLHFSSMAGTRAFWRALFLGGLGWGLSYINILVFLELAGSLPIGFSGALLVFVMTTFGGAIPALPGGLGTYEAAAVVALRSLGYGFDEALVLAIAMHASQLVLPFALAILIMLTERTGMSSLIADLRRSAAVATDSGSCNEKGSRVND